MTVDKALEILNKNDSGRVYTRSEAALLMDFYGKLAKIEAKKYKHTRTTHLRIA